MSKVSNAKDCLNSSSDVSNIRKPCPLVAYGCQDQELTSTEEHPLNAMHQKALVILTQQRANKNIHKNSTERITVKFQKHDDSLSASTELLQTLNDEMQHLDSNMLLFRHRQASLSEDIHKAEKALLAEKNHMNAISINQQILIQESTSLKQQIEYGLASNNQHVLDGSMIWQITQVREKMYDAQSERQTSVYSPPFYTSNTGYKLCTRLYLNGDGAARGTHLSIFLVILRGEYDILLQWPFTYQVNFCLFDQRAILQSLEANQTQHVIGSFRPDANSSSFRRPCSAMNIASGIPKFLPLENLDDFNGSNRYIVNDTMFIKVFIDFLGVSKSIVAFIFNLNVALPMHIQRKLVDDEIKRQNESNNG